MSRHGITTVKQAQKAERAIERCFSELELAIDGLQFIALRVDSATFSALAQEMHDQMVNAIHDSSLETFRDDCKQAVADWDGKEDFWRVFDEKCRITP